MNTLIDNPWLRLATLPENAPWNLICFPFAGGSAEYFLPWYQALHPIGLCPVQLPGRAARWQETALHHMSDLMNEMMPYLIPVLNAKPYVLFGHSMGGQIAYRVAQTIQSLDLPPPTCLMISATPAPCTWNERQKLSGLSDEAFELFFKTLGGFHPDILQHQSFMAMQMKLLKDDIRLCESVANCHESAEQVVGHRNPNDQQRLVCPVMALSGIDDPFVSVDNMSLWQHVTEGLFQHEKMSGHHFYLTEKKDNLLAFIRALNPH